MNFVRVCMFQEAVKAGASRTEILEAAGVSTMMAGGPGLTFAGAVLLE